MLLDSVCTSLESNNNNNNNSYAKHHRFMPKWCKVDDLGRPTPPPRHGHRAVTIKGLMLVFGGGNEGIVNELHVYDTSTNTWCVPDLRGHRPPGFAAYGMVTNQSKVFIFGGMIEYGRYSNDLYELQINRWEWRKLNIQILEGQPKHPCPRLGHTFTMGSNNIAYVFGGLANASADRRENVPEYLNDFYAIDLSTAPSGLSWHCPKTNCQSPPTRESHTAVYFTTNTGNQQLIIYGGMNGQRLGDVWILDLESMNWSNPLPQGFGPLPRSLHTANLIENRMFIFGGWVPNDSDDNSERPNKGWKCTNTLAVLNLSTLRWEHSLGPPTPVTATTYSTDFWPTARAGHCSAVINKRIYIWSGRDGYKKLQNSQVCCKDMFYLETEPPAVPSSIQLVKASVNSLEISWSPSTTADRYVLQIQRAEHQSDPEKVGRRSVGGGRVAQRQQHFTNVGAGGGGGGGTPLSSSSHNQQQRAVLTGGGGGGSGSNSASSSPVRAFRPTTMSNTVTSSSSPFHHRRYYQQPHHQQQFHLSTASASAGSSPVLLAARPLRIKPSAGAASSCPRPSSIVVQQQPQQQLRIVQQHMNRNDIASTGNVVGGTTDATVATASSSPVSSLHHPHHQHQQHQLNMTTPRTIVVHKSSSSLMPSSDAEGGGGGGVADPATTTIAPLAAGPKRFYVHASGPPHQQHVAAVAGGQPPVMVRRQLPNCPPRQQRQAMATSNTFDILPPPAKMVKHMEFVPTVSDIISPTEPPLSSTTTTKTTTYSVPAAPVVIDQTMPHNILDEALNEAENFVDGHQQQYIQQHHAQPPFNVDNANEHIDSQSAEQQQQFDGIGDGGDDGNPLSVEAKTAAATHQHHDQIGDDDDEGGDDDEKEIEQQHIETGGRGGGQEDGKNIANDNDDDDDAKSKWTTSDAEALGMTMTMTKSEDNNNMFSTRATTNNDNDNTTDKSDVEKTTDDNSVVVGDEYVQLGVEQMRAIDPDSEKDATALKEEAAERLNAAAQLLQPLERDYEQQQHQQQQQEDDQLLLDVSAVVDEPLPEEQPQHNQQQQQHVVGGGGGGGEQSQQQFATEEEEEQPVSSDEQPQPQQVQQQQYGFRHYQQQPQIQHVPADMVDCGGGRATQQHPMDAEKEDMEEEQDELGNSIGVGTRIVSIAEQQHLQQLLPMSVVESSSSSIHGRRHQQQQDITAAQPEHHHYPIPIGQRRSASSSASDFVAQHSPFDSGNKWFHVVDLPSSEQRFVITEYSVPCYDRGGGGSGSATTTESVRRKRRAIEYASQLPDEQQQEQQQKTAATEQIALEPGTLYRIRVRAINSVGCSAWSQPVSFKTCVPGFPGSPTSIKITKCAEGVFISWDPPLSPNGQIEEYSVFLLMRSPQHQQQHASMMRSQQQQQQSVAVSSFTRVYMGPAPNCVISHSVLGMAHVDTASTPKPAIIFRISARNEKGYGSATQVRWLQESPRVLPLAVMPPGTLQPMPHGTLLTTTTGPSLPSPLPSSGDTTAQLVMPQQQQQLYHQQQQHHVLSLPSSATAGGRAVQQHHHRRSAASPAVVYQQPQQQQQHQQHYHHNQQRSTAANMMMSSGPANMNISVREFLSNNNAASRGGDR